MQPLASPTPLRIARQVARQELSDGFIEVYVKASIETVQTRDPKGLYERLRKGEGEPMIGMPGATPFEAPEQPDLVLDTESFDYRTLATMLEELISQLLGQVVPTKETRV